MMIPAIAIGVSFLLLVFSLLFLLRFYQTGELDQAFVRTGMGGQRVSIGGGMFIFPRIHYMQRVTLRTLKLDVKAEGARGMGIMRTKDALPIMLDAEVYVHVPRKKDAVLAAAQTLGEKADPKAILTGSRGGRAAASELTAGQDYEDMAREAIKDLVDKKLISAIRSVVATLTLEDLHANRELLKTSVADILDHDLRDNGLELETVAIESIDQEPLLDIKKRSEQNTFDASAYATLSRKIEEMKTSINEAEKTQLVNRESQNTDYAKKTLELEQERVFAKEEQQREVQNKVVLEQANIAQYDAELYQKKTDAVETAHLVANRKVEEVARDLEIFQQECEEARRTKSAETDEKINERELARDNKIETLEEQVKKDIQAAAMDRVKHVGALASETKKTVGVAHEEARKAIGEAEVTRDEAIEVRIVEKDENVETRTQSLEQTKEVTNLARAKAANSKEKIETARAEEKLHRENVLPEEKEAAAKKIKAAGDAVAALERKKETETKAEADAQAKIVIPAAKNKEKAEHEKQQKILDAEGVKQQKILDAEGEALAEVKKGQGEREAALARGEAAAAQLEWGKADAEAKRLKNQAAIIGAEAKLLDSENVVKYFLAKQAPELVSAAFKPLESIEGMRILQVNTGGESGDAGGMNSVLRNLTNAAPGGALINEMLNMSGSDKTMQDLLEMLIGNSAPGQALGQQAKEQG